MTSIATIFNPIQQDKSLILQWNSNSELGIVAVNRSSLNDSNLVGRPPKEPKHHERENALRRERGETCDDGEDVLAKHASAARLPDGFVGQTVQSGSSLTSFVYKDLINLYGITPYTDPNTKKTTSYVTLISPFYQLFAQASNTTTAIASASKDMNNAWVYYLTNTTPPTMMEMALIQGGNVQQLGLSVTFNAKSYLGGFWDPVQNMRCVVYQTSNDKLQLAGVQNPSPVPYTLDKIAGALDGTPIAACYNPAGEKQFFVYYLDSSFSLWRATGTNGTAGSPDYKIINVTNTGFVTSQYTSISVTPGVDTDGTSPVNHVFYVGTDGSTINHWPDDLTIQG